MNYLIEIAAYVCECVTLLLCIHSFLGKKIKLDYKTILLVVTLVTILMIILNLELSDIYTMINQVIIFAYIHFEFRINWRQNLILMLLVWLTNVAIQAITVMPIYILLIQMNIEAESILMGLCINLVSLIVMIASMKVLSVNKLYIKLVKVDKKIIKILLYAGALLAYFMIEYKFKNRVEIKAYFVSGLLATVLLILIFYWQKDRYENKKKNLELRMHKLYGDAFESMIENIRIRQHDFKNQLAAIYGMHLTANNFEELVECQREYCNHLIGDSRYDSILTKCNDKILAGFLYTKLNEAEKQGVKVDFDIVVESINYKLEIYEIIEVMGILIDNAVEYEPQTEKKIFIAMKEKDEKLCIICRNVVEYIPIDEVYKFFKKGFSTKGKDRGLGLYNLKKLLDGRGEIIIASKMIEKEDWLEFNIEINEKN